MSDHSLVAVVCVLLAGVIILDNLVKDAHPPTAVATKWQALAQEHATQKYFTTETVSTGERFSFVHPKLYCIHPSCQKELLLSIGKPAFYEWFFCKNE